MLVALPYCDLGIMVYVVLGSYSTKTKEKGTKIVHSGAFSQGYTYKIPVSYRPQREAGTWLILKTAADTLDVGLHDSSLC